jgi:hypothetical protein
MRIVLLLMFTLYCTLLQAQEVVASSGSTLTNANGSLQFTIGESVTNTLTKGEKTITQGFNQPVVSVSIISEVKNLDFSITAYPNPATDILTIKVGKNNITGLQFLMFDLKGSLLLQKDIESSETVVSVELLQTGIYIMRINEGLKELKSFKIIKQ